jgi:hypothetical protein
MNNTFQNQIYLRIHWTSNQIEENKQNNVKINFIKEHSDK